MLKELKVDLFNIYDVVVFEDENGITQDCVCSFEKDKEVNEIVDMIECNNHSISIYENGSYKVWEKDGKGMPYYFTNKEIIHLYTLKNDNRFYEVYPTNDYEPVDNVNPSGALEILETFENDGLLNKEIGMISYNQIWLKNQIEVLKQTLLEAQEQNFNYKNIVIPFFNELVKLLGTNDTDEMLDKIKEQEKVLNIIKEKCVSVWHLMKSKTVEEYNSYLYVEDIEDTKNFILTEEEFDLLKEML